MKYLLLVCVDPSIEPTEKPGQIDAWLDRLGERRLIGDQLVGPSSAATVRVREGKPLVTDGPFAETKEIVVGFDVVECDSRDEVLEIAAAHPVAAFGAIEVRAFYDA